ncbi:MAG: phosphatase PAP2 family protein [Actinomycetota bacterium]|nr:phosphatase PAP2 family protein [Actinomycetota bacterium]
MQFGLFFAVYNGYQLVRGLAEGRADLAFANAQRIIDIEVALGTLFEPGLQEALINHARWLVDLSNFMYLNSHFVVTTAFLTWLYFRRNEHFYFVRNMFMVAMVLALALYALLPTAPPRLLDSDFGFVDTIAVYTGLPQDSDTVGVLVNQYAAVPSMHIGFALMVAVPAAALVSNPVARAWWAAYPLIVFFVIVATGNHFWLDAAAGAAVACVAALTATQLARARSDHWAWPDARAGAPA